ncbi:Uncharacterised protein [Weeksella virosa]|uniref:hypothetical protein n=1 Tax=Weeksella virosa TaxID=1014 RepID=UPI000DF91D58|nr:hypothetical protein [Weeksella virosa]SUP53874.1 Uncharacterised protein [Weeksella virosa]
MTLRYIALGLDYNTYIKTDNKLRYQFQLHTRFISNYFSKAIRKYKFDTNGTFNMISISLLPDNGSVETKITAINVLETYLPFDQKRYEQIKGTEDCSYYLELLEQGFKKASEFTPIPLDTLLNLIGEFKKGGCKNEWLHKKKRFTEEDLEVVLTCEFTTNYFQLIATINQISTKKQLVKGVVIRTEPDEVLFDKMFKDIYIDDNIIITDSSDSPRIIIDKGKIFAGKLDFEIRGDKEIQEMLSYEL